MNINDKFRDLYSFCKLVGYKDSLYPLESPGKEEYKEYKEFPKELATTSYITQISQNKIEENVSFSIALQYYLGLKELSIQFDKNEREDKSFLNNMKRDLIFSYLEIFYTSYLNRKIKNIYDDILYNCIKSLLITTIKTTDDKILKRNFITINQKEYDSFIHCIPLWDKNNCFIDSLIVSMFLTTTYYDGLFDEEYKVTRFLLPNTNRIKNIDYSYFSDHESKIKNNKRSNHREVIRLALKDVILSIRKIVPFNDNRINSFIESTHKMIRLRSVLFNNGSIGSLYQYEDPSEMIIQIIQALGWSEYYQPMIREFKVKKDLDYNILFNSHSLRVNVTKSISIQEAVNKSLELDVYDSSSIIRQETLIYLPNTLFITITRFKVVSDYRVVDLESIPIDFKDGTFVINYKENMIRYRIISFVCRIDTNHYVLYFRYYKTNNWYLYNDINTSDFSFDNNIKDPLQRTEVITKSRLLIAERI